MNLTSQQLINFVNRIKFSTVDKSEYKSQIENLIIELDDYLLRHSDLSIVRVLQAGSWRKATILKPSTDVPLDIDLAFYLNTSKISNISDFHNVNSKIVELLRKIYPSKSEKDFYESTKTSNVKFITSGLSVDIVPVEEIPPSQIHGFTEYVKQPDSETNVYYITSVKKQISFIVERKKDNQNFTAIVRILKYWKYAKSLPISSFTIELVVAYLDIKKEVVLNVEEAVIRFFTLLSSKKFPVISFDAPIGFVDSSSSHIYVADPTNNANNSAKYIKQKDWDLVRYEASVALDTLCYAQSLVNSYRTIELWREVFGPEFNVTP
jgi:hypothetical protein